MKFSSTTEKDVLQNALFRFEMKNNKESCKSCF